MIQTAKEVEAEKRLSNLEGKVDVILALNVVMIILSVLVQ